MKIKYLKQLISELDDDMIVVLRDDCDNTLRSLHKVQAHDAITQIKNFRYSYFCGIPDPEEEIIKVLVLD